MPRPVVNSCPLCNKPATLDHSIIYCKCGLSLETDDNLADKWNGLSTNNAAAQAKITMQRKEIRALVEIIDKYLAEEEEARGGCVGNCRV